MLTVFAFIASAGIFADVAIHAPTDLVAAAAATGRPAECMPAAPGREGRVRGVWSRARIPNLQRYCGLIARAHARLAESPDAAREAAELADSLVPERAAPRVVMARVALREGNVAAADKAFRAALALDARSVEQPVAMHDLALTHWKSGHLKEALATYRVLVPRASLLPDRGRRARVLLEAAHVAMAVAPGAGDGTTRILDEALAYLREASRDMNHHLEHDVALSLVLALDRAGRGVQADALLAEQRGSAAWITTAKLDYLASKDDRALMRGLALEKHDPGEAAKSYQSYLETAKGSYAAAVEARLARLAKPAPTRGRGR